MRSLTNVTFNSYNTYRNQPSAEAYSCDEIDE